MSPAKTPSTVDSKPLKLDEILARKFHETSPHSRGYLSTVQPVSYGKCLVASNDLTPGTVVEKFEGPEVDYSTVHGDHKNYVLNYSPPGSAEYTGWMFVQSAAKYSNHSCDPNCVINDNLELETVRNVKKGDELTFLYNAGSEDDEWDPVWTFQCQCSSQKCQGMIDRYR